MKAMNQLIRSVVLPALVAATSLTSVAALATDTTDAALPFSGGIQEVHARDGRQVLADAKGLTVYTFTPDKNDVSVCYDTCAKEWPPVLVEKTAVLKAPFATTTRKDGTTQVTYNHRPIYEFINDKVVGDILGDGDDGIWFVIVAKASK